MFSLHCTARLLKVLRVPATPDPPPATTLLGNWYANLLPLRGRPVILCVSERSLLPVLLPAGANINLPRLLAVELGTVLADLGVPSELIERERFAMAQSTCAKTSSRSVLGVMNEFAFAVADELEDGAESLHDLSLWLAGIIVKNEHPDEVTRALFGVRERTRHGTDRACD